MSSNKLATLKENSLFTLLTNMLRISYGMIYNTVDNVKRYSMLKVQSGTDLRRRYFTLMKYAFEVLDQ